MGGHSLKLALFGSHHWRMLSAALVQAVSLDIGGGWLPGR